MKTIETDRLILRPLVREDITPYLRLGQDPEVIRYVGNQPLADEAAALQIMEENALREYKLYGYGRFGCVLKETGELIGFCGLKYVPELEAVDLGYRFVPEYWGRGLATESGIASIEFARELGIPYLVGLVVPENTASARVLTKLGFTFERKQNVDFWHVGEDVDRYGMTLS